MHCANALCILHSRANIIEVSGTLRPKPRACLALGRLVKDMCHGIGTYDLFAREENFAHARVAVSTKARFYMFTLHIRRFTHHSHESWDPLTKIVISNVLHCHAGIDRFAI